MKKKQRRRYTPEDMRGLARSILSEVDTGRRHVDFIASFDENNFYVEFELDDLRRVFDRAAADTYKLWRMIASRAGERRR